MPKNSATERVRSPRSPLSKLLVVAAIALSTAGLSGCQKKHFEWSEDVRLADGSEVKIERTIRYGKVLSELGGPTSAWISEARVTIVDHGRPLPTWSHPMKPFLLQKDTTTGHWLLVASAQDACEYAKRFGPPVPTFPTFELQGNEWVYLGLPDAIVGQRANLLLGVPGSDHGSHLLWTDVIFANERRFPALEWRSVDATKVGTCDREMNRNNSRH